MSRGRAAFCHWRRSPLCERSSPDRRWRRVGETDGERGGPGRAARARHEGRSMVLVHVGYLVLPVFGSVRNRGTASCAGGRGFASRDRTSRWYWVGFVGGWLGNGKDGERWGCTSEPRSVPCPTADPDMGFLFFFPPPPLISTSPPPGYPLVSLPPALR